jgi:hypothetical protein
MQATRHTPTLIRTAWLLAAACLAPAAAQAAAPPSKDTAPARVGQIIIVNTRARTSSSARCRCTPDRS